MEFTKIKKIKELKKQIKNPKFIRELQDTQEAVKNAVVTKRYNKIFILVILECIKKLKKHGESEIEIEFENEKQKFNFEEMQDDFIDIIKENYAKNE